MINHGLICGLVLFQERDSVEAEKLERTIFVGNLLNTPKLRKKLKVLFSQ